MSRLFACVLALAAAVPVSGPAAELALQHDPFRRPDFNRAPAGRAAAVAAVQWRPQLRGVVVAGPASLANIDGQLVPLGGRIEGYRLELVGETQVVLRKDRALLELWLEGIPREKP